MNYPPDIPENTYWKHDIHGMVIQVLERCQDDPLEGYNVSALTTGGTGTLGARHIARCYTQIAEADLPLHILGGV